MIYISGDELFTEVYKITEVCDGMLYEVQGKVRERLPFQYRYLPFSC